MTPFNTPMFVNQEIEETANNLKSLGYKVYVVNWRGNRKPYTYFYFTNGVNIGYCENDYTGPKFYTVHKPSKAFGVGFNLESYIQNLSESIADKATLSFTFQQSEFISAQITKYKDWDDFTKNNTPVLPEQYQEY